jgi:BMFP domain-containing protein YqiC
MQSKRIFDDLSRVAEGAASALQGIRDEVETIVRHRIERLVSDLDLVTREEFEAARMVAIRAREEQDALTARIAELETRLRSLEEASREFQ